MTKVATIIDQALKDLGIVGEGQTASGSALADSFDTLNQMLAMWQANGLMVYAHKAVNVELTGAASYSVGVGGAVNMPRPHQIDGAVCSVNGADYPVEMLGSFSDYERADKGGASAMPAAIRYEPTYPLGTLYVLPSVATGTLTLIARVDLPTYIGTTDDIALPPEYALAVRYSLAELLSAVFATPLRPDVAALATRYRKMVKRQNVSIPKSRMPDALGGVIYHVGCR